MDHCAYANALVVRVAVYPHGASGTSGSVLAVSTSRSRNGSQRAFTQQPHTARAQLELNFDKPLRRAAAAPRRRRNVRVGGEARSRYDDDWYDELPIATDESKRRRKTVSRYSSRSGLLRTEDAPGRFDGSRFTDSMVAGALAGLAVDGALFPMDTLKTRLQSPAGFRASGVANLYRGIGVCLMGSAPCSALFFSTFEAAHGPIERALAAAGASPPAAASALAGGGEARFGTEMWFGGVNALAAAAGELVASTLRVPVEALKQRLQTGQPPGCCGPAGRRRSAETCHSR